jgi:SnoaL-like polyketide cyclase
MAPTGAAPLVRPGADAGPRRLAGTGSWALRAGRAFPDNEVHHPYYILFGEGDFTCFVTHFTGTFTAPLEMPDGTVIQPTGKPFDVLYSTAARWRDDKIIEESSSTTTALSSSRSASPEAT